VPGLLGELHQRCIRSTAKVTKPDRSEWPAKPFRSRQHAGRASSPPGRRRALIAERTRLALAQRKAQGALLGNRTNLAKAHEVNRATAEAFAANVLPIVRQIQAAGVSGLQNVANALNDRGVRTARGDARHTARCAISWHGRERSNNHSARGNNHI
jgi:hypothetical protein